MIILGRGYILSPFAPITDCVCSVEITNGEIVLNDAGWMVEKYWLEITRHYPDAVLHEYIVMPNHVHGIIETVVDETWADQNIVSGTGTKRAGLEPAPTDGMVGKQASIPEIVRQLKTFSAKRINRLKNTAGTPVWQRNYYEHIIRNEKFYNRISQYIETNPLRWQHDKYYADPHMDIAFELCQNT